MYHKDILVCYLNMLCVIVFENVTKFLNWEYWIHATRTPLLTMLLFYSKMEWSKFTTVNDVLWQNWKNLRVSLVYCVSSTHWNFLLLVYRIIQRQLVNSFTNYDINSVKSLFMYISLTKLLFRVFVWTTFNLKLVCT